MFIIHRLYRCNSQLIHAYFLLNLLYGKYESPKCPPACMSISGLNTEPLLFHACTPKPAPSQFLGLLACVPLPVVLITLLNRTHWESMGSAGLKGSTRSTVCQTAASHSPKLLSPAQLQTLNSREVLLCTSPFPMPRKGCSHNLQDKAAFVTAF